MTKTIYTVLIAVLFTACTKKGEPGPAGKDGKNGSTNISTYIISTTASNWTYDGTDKSYNATVNISSITASVVSNGSVQAFIGDGTGTAWDALPAAYQNVQWNYSYSSGQILVYLTMSDGSVPPNPGIQQFKYVVIPPGAKKQNVQTDIN